MAAVVAVRRPTEKVSSMEDKKVSLKLLIDTKANNVLFAEARKDFVDFLFSLLSLPVGSVVKLLNNRSSVGCFENLYQSFANLDETYVESDLDKGILLDPGAFANVTNIPLLMVSSNYTPSSMTKYYTCNQNHGYVTTEIGLDCPSCDRMGYGLRSMKRELNYVKGNGVASATANVNNLKGFVKGVVTYMISDDLIVTPMSVVSAITLMKKYDVSNLHVVEERAVDVGLDEGLELLKASFITKATLTAVFLAKDLGSDPKSFEGASHADRGCEPEREHSCGPEELRPVPTAKLELDSVSVCAIPW